MKAKRILAVILAAISLAGYGCSDRIELSREAVDSKFVPGHMAGTVMYVKSGDVLVPIDTRHNGPICSARTRRRTANSG